MLVIVVSVVVLDIDSSSVAAVLICARSRYRASTMLESEKVQM